MRSASASLLAAIGLGLGVAGCATDTASLDSTPLAVVRAAQSSNDPAAGSGSASAPRRRSAVPLRSAAAARAGSGSARATRRRSAVRQRSAAAARAGSGSARATRRRSAVPLRSAVPPRSAAAAREARTPAAPARPRAPEPARTRRVADAPGLVAAACEQYLAARAGRYPAAVRARGEARALATVTESTAGALLGMPVVAPAATRRARERLDGAHARITRALAAGDDARATAIARATAARIEGYAHELGIAGCG